MDFLRARFGDVRLHVEAEVGRYCERCIKIQELSLRTFYEVSHTEDRSNQWFGTTKYHDSSSSGLLVAIIKTQSLSSRGCIRIEIWLLS